jgi:iron complex transport system permease protein
MTSSGTGAGVAGDWQTGSTGFGRSRLGGRWLFAGIASVLVAAVLGVATGPVSIPIWQVIVELADRLPIIDVDSSLSPADRAIVWDLRAPRVVLGLLVGALLAGSGAAY